MKFKQKIRCSNPSHDRLKSLKQVMTARGVAMTVVMCKHGGFTEAHSAEWGWVGEGTGSPPPGGGGISGANPRNFF